MHNPVNYDSPDEKRHLSMQGIPVQFGGSRLIVVSSHVREVCLPVHVLSAEETECHRFVSRSNGEVQDHQRLHEAVRGRLASIGFSELKHYVVGYQAGYSLEHAVFRLSLSTTSDFNG